jgi:NAD(P)-dependent dehydrogenase (short-subunit alcohol dehydrogenase family)
VSGKAYTTVLISDTNSGFGLETARKLAYQGYRVCGTMRDERRNAGARTNLSVPTSPSSISTSPIRTRWIGVALVLQQAGHLDVLINNAGATHLGITEGYTLAALERQFAVNVFGPLRLSRAFLPGSHVPRRAAAKISCETSLG